MGLCRVSVPPHALNEQGTLEFKFGLSSWATLCSNNRSYTFTHLRSFIISSSLTQSFSCLQYREMFSRFGSPISIGPSGLCDIEFETGGKHEPTDHKGHKE